MKLLKSAAIRSRIRITSEMENELQRFEPIIAQAVRLREASVDVIDRAQNITVPNLVKQIREKKKEEQ